MRPRTLGDFDSLPWWREGVNRSFGREIGSVYERRINCFFGKRLSAIRRTVGGRHRKIFYQGPRLLRGGEKKNSPPGGPKTEKRKRERRSIQDLV